MKDLIDKIAAKLGESAEESNPIFEHLKNLAPLKATGGDDPKPKKGYDPVAEMKVLSSKPLKYDNNRTSIDIAKSVADKLHMNPAFLYSSAMQEGMNQSIAHPEDVSEAYNNAKIGSDYPVDGFYAYGLDTFGTRYNDLVKKGYLTPDFQSQFKPYEAFNEKKEKITTAAFKNNEAALMAKAALMRDEMDNVDAYAKTLGLTLDDKARNYFTLASYNGGFGNAKLMLGEYAKAKDKNAFIDKGLTTRGGVHKNIAPRLSSMLTAQEFFATK